MKNPLITCPKCKSTFAIESRSGQQITNWNTLAFSCNNCKQKIIINNLNSESNTMKKIQLQKNCLNCNAPNAIVSVQSDADKKVIRKCENCQKDFEVDIPGFRLPNMNQAHPTIPTRDENTTRTFVLTRNKVKTKLQLEIDDTPTSKKQLFEINQDYMTIGRKNDTTNKPDIAIETTDLTISRVHAVIQYYEKKNAYSIKDAGSINKTYVNEEVLKDSEEKILVNGSKVRIGKTTIVVKIQST